MRRLAILALAAGTACARPSSTGHPVAAVAPIDSAELRRDLYAFAADSFLGRSARGPNGARASHMIAQRLAQLGVEPAGDSGGYLQRVPNLGDEYNVVGIVRGSDPTLRNSYVAFGAHLDHIGYRKGMASGDSIANGADDDGSGSVALLAIARVAVQTRNRPRRSMLFVWHTGEELGLVGSTWFTNHPTVPLDSVIAQLNADMVGRNALDSLYLVGPNAAPNGQSHILGQIVDSVNASLPHPFLINREWDSPTHPERIYYRSDHYNYAKHGVPIVFFTSGLHADYHQVSDEPSKINYDKLARVARLIYQSGVAAANRPTHLVPTAQGGQ